MTDHQRSILVVDDDADARMVMRAALRKAGFAVRTADGGEDALRQFRDQACDLVMLDVDMPGISGHAVCAILRAEAGPLLPIVMVTGMDDVASVETAYQQGATDFIVKPVNWALIGHHVRYLFRGVQALLDLQAAEARNTAILNAIPDLLVELDADGRYLDHRSPDNRQEAQPASQLLGRTVAEVLPPAAAWAYMGALALAQERGSASGAQFELPGPQGSRWYELSVASKAVPSGEKPRFIVLSRDITERKIAEAGVARLAYVDSLTGLPNRLSFMDRVTREVRRAEAAGEQLAVMFMDMDGFKNINDSLGHACGDLVLQMAAQRLRDGLRHSDAASRPMPLDAAEHSDDVHLARLGGDEFTTLVRDIDTPEDALAVAMRLGKLMRQPFLVDGRALTLTTSIGIAIYPQDGTDATTLLKHADTAMYQAKRAGRDNAQLYRAALTTELMHRMELDAGLRAALARQEFHLVYQPQIDARSGRVCAVEALIRWTHPTRGLVSPMDFIPLAEELGLIARIGQWVLHTACTDAARWLAAGSPVRVAVNLSPLQFGNPDLPGLVMDTLAQAGLPPALLELEITEGALMQNTATTQLAVRALRNQGVHMALDDFGTGYSSLSYLTRMPISVIKIDKCFITGLLDDGQSQAIVRAVLAMAGSLAMQVTAEGVETLAQAQALRAMACDRLQGYHFSRPVAPAQIPALLARQWRLDGGDTAAGAATPGSPAGTATRHDQA
jgi:predicted signal transduction protein with EAL and GGDEF domain/FixJ family two-component response regulator